MVSARTKSEAAGTEMRRGRDTGKGEQRTWESDVRSTEWKDEGYTQIFSSFNDLVALSTECVNAYNWLI